MNITNMNINNIVNNMYGSINNKKESIRSAFAQASETDLVAQAIERTYNKAALQELIMANPNLPIDQHLMKLSDRVFDGFLLRNNIRPEGGRFHNVRDIKKRIDNIFMRFAQQYPPIDPNEIDPVKILEASKDMCWAKHLEKKIFWFENSGEYKNVTEPIFFWRHKEDLCIVIRKDDFTHPDALWAMEIQCFTKGIQYYFDRSKSEPLACPYVTDELFYWDTKDLVQFKGCQLCKNLPKQILSQECEINKDTCFKDMFWDERCVRVAKKVVTI